MESASSRDRSFGTMAPCCMDRWCGRTEPYPCSGSCDADVLRASQLQHSVQHVGRDGHLARLSPVRLQTQPLAEDARWRSSMISRSSWAIAAMTVRIMRLIALAMLPLASGEALLRPEPGGQSSLPGRGS